MLGSGVRRLRFHLTGYFVVALSLALVAVALGEEPGPPPATLLAQMSGSSNPLTPECPECNPPKKFWPAFGELMAVQFIPWSVNHYMRDAEWADISPETWWTNMSNPWLWDKAA